MRARRWHRWLLGVGLAAGGAGLLLLASPARAQYRIDIYGGQKVVIAVAGFPEFRTAGSTEDHGRLAQEVLRADLKNTGIFDVMDPAQLPFEPASVALGQERTVLPGLNALKVQFLAVGALSTRGRDLVLEGRLLDVAQGNEITANRYFGEPSVLRRVVHRFADEIFYRLTGEKGIASTRVAFVSAISAREKELFIMDYDGWGAMPITSNREVNLSPRWSPDGRWIAYTSYRDGNPDLWKVDLETGARSVISKTPGLNMSPAWSPDGQWIAFARSAPGTGQDIFLIRPDGSGLRQLTNTPRASISPSFSPDGQKLVFNSDRMGSPQIFVMDVTGDNVARLSLQGSYNASPRWSPKGDKIAYTSRINGSFQIFVMDRDGSNVRQLTTVGSNEDPTWAPDGRHIAFTSNRDGRRNIYWMFPDGTEQRRITNNGRDNYLPDWSP